MSNVKAFFQFFRQDASASISLFLITLPVTIGIAVASGVPPEAGVISTVFGAFFFGFFSSGHFSLVGPAAGLCVFLASYVQHSGEVQNIAFATLISGTFLIFLGLLRAYRVIHIIPISVTKGLIAGIGLTLILKMIPHLVGFDHTVLESVDFVDIDSNGGTTWSDLLKAWENLSMGAILVSSVSFLLIWLQRPTKSSTMPYAFLVLMFGAILNWALTQYFPSLALHDAQLVQMTSNQFNWKFLVAVPDQLWPSIRLAFIITTVILLEGSINLGFIEKLDPHRRPIRFQREFFLLGIGNIAMGLVGALPIMPILIRSSANIEFGAKTRLSPVLLGFWFLIAFSIASLLNYIPMASVAALLVLVGAHLVKKVNLSQIYSKGKNQLLPFFITVVAIVCIDLLWGILLGFAMGVFFTLRSLVHRSMFVVNDGDRYLLKFFKDVTFIHKGQLVDCLESIPSDKVILIDGTGNVSLDHEIEDWLLEYQEEQKSQGREIIFAKSQLAVSGLFKGVNHGQS